MIKPEGPIHRSHGEVFSSVVVGLGFIFVDRVRFLIGGVSFFILETPWMQCRENSQGGPE